MKKGHNGKKTCNKYLLHNKYFNIPTTKGEIAMLQTMKIQVRNSGLTCIVIELLPAAILGTRATGVGEIGRAHV
jgi:hypothetical protein